MNLILQWVFHRYILWNNTEIKCILFYFSMIISIMLLALLICLAYSHAHTSSYLCIFAFYIYKCKFLIRHITILTNDFLQIFSIVTQVCMESWLIKSFPAKAGRYMGRLCGLYGFNGASFIFIVSPDATRQSIS